MYIFELLAKLRKNHSAAPPPAPPTPAELMEGEDMLEDPLECEHLFVPIDSTGEVFACSKCGWLITEKPKIKSTLDKNPFIKPR